MWNSNWEISNTEGLRIDCYSGMLFPLWILVTIQIFSVFRRSTTRDIGPNSLGQGLPKTENKIINSAGNIFGTNSFSKLLHTPFKNYQELFPKKPLLGSSTTMFRYLLWHLIWAQVLHDELVLQIHRERYLGSQVHFGICRPKVGEKWHYNHLWPSILFF